jgi:hypothetical protein
MSAALALTVLATQSQSRTRQLFIGIAAGLLLLDDRYYAYTIQMPLLFLVGMLAILPKTRRAL